MSTMIRGFVGLAVCLGLVGTAAVARGQDGHAGSQADRGARAAGQGCGYVGRDGQELDGRARFRANGL